MYESKGDPKISLEYGQSKWYGGVHEVHPLKLLVSMTDVNEK